MNNFFNDFFSDDFFPLGFAKPSKLVFNTNNLHDMTPARWKKTDYGYVGIFKTLGCENISLTVKEYGIQLFGKGEVFGNKYDTTIDLPVSEDVLDNIIEINHETKAGITKIELIVNKPEKKKIKINGKEISQ